jgi:3-hydroxyacyl-[acyl-carrier-protein] dehydratase
MLKQNKNPLISELYTIISKSDDKVILKLSDQYHPIFKAHFPSNPILPGFIHFEILSEIFNLEISNIKKAKFSKPVTPNQILEYEKNKNKFKVSCNKQDIASFTL